MYGYALLDPRPTPGAAEHNDRILGDGSTVLGIEVTVPELAARCGLGNIDPQHLGGHARVAAIEAAFHRTPPTAGTTLVTVRPDADSVGAMALLTYRGENPLPPVRGDGFTVQVDVRPEKLRVRVRMIADADKEAARPWPGPRPPAAPEELVSEVGVAQAAVMNHTIPFTQRVQLMMDWLTGGDFTGREEIRARLAEEARTAWADCVPTVRDGVAVVVGTHRLATSLGYRLAPVVVATNPAFRFAGGEPHRKHTVCRWNSSVPMDWDGLLAELRSREPGWGGSTSIAGSPQGVGSSLTTDVVAALVAKHAKGA